MNIKKEKLKLSMNERSTIMRAASLLEAAADLVRLHNKKCALQRDLIVLSQRLAIVSCEEALAFNFKTR